VSANSTISANVHFSEETLPFSRRVDHQESPVLTSVLTVTKKKRGGKRFQRVGHGLFRFKRTGTIYGVFKLNGRTRWKSLSTNDPSRARLLLMDEIKSASQVDWRHGEKCTLKEIIEKYLQNPMGLSAGTLQIRKQLLKVFDRTWAYGMGKRVSEVKAIMLKSWVAERRQEQSLKASGVNNYIRTLHGLFQIAVEMGAIAESPAKGLKLLKEENPERLTPSWEQAHAIIGKVKRQNGKDVLSAMLLLGLGQAELANLRGEHIDFERGQMVVRRQKTQRVFTIPIYPQARPLLVRFKSEGRMVPGKPLFERANPREALSLACRRLGYPQFSPRSFRRAFIVRALEKGIDPRCVAAWQGHRDATLVLRVYGHIIQPAHNQAMAQLLE
jgi:integrase